MGSLFQRFSQQTTHILAAAQRISEELDRLLTSELVLMYLLEHGQGMVKDVLTGMSLEKHTLVEAILALPLPSQQDNHIPPELSSVLEHALVLAHHYQSHVVEPEHLFLALLEHKESRARALLMAAGVDVVPLQNRVHEWLAARRDMVQARERVLSGKANQRDEEERDPLEAFCTNLTERAEEGLLDAVVGRDHQLDPLG